MLICFMLYICDASATDTFQKNNVTKEAIAHYELLFHLPKYFKLYLKVSVKEIFNKFAYVFSISSAANLLYLGKAG